jgi:hypothetical protein
LIGRNTALLRRCTRGSTRQVSEIIVRKEGAVKSEQDKNTEFWKVEENENGNGSKKKKEEEAKDELNNERKRNRFVIFETSDKCGSSSLMTHSLTF